MTPISELIDHKHIQDAVLRNVELATEALNRELHQAEIVRLDIAVHVDNTIGRPIRVSVVKLPPEGNRGPHPLEW